MDGVLVVDKPSGITSHDVVAVARRALGETRIGHTGTLDPLATGVLVLACGRATRLVQLLTASDKDYEATIRFGLVTDSYDITGTALEQSDQRPERDTVEQALVSLRGDYLQMPPPYSAKKVGGRRAYALARRNEPVALSPASVRVDRAETIAFAGSSVTVAITCSAGFYVRSFAHALGQAVGAGACLEALRRTRSGAFGVADALPFEALSHASRDTLSPAIVPIERLLMDLPAVRVTEEGRAHVRHGRVLSLGSYVRQAGIGDSGSGARGSGLATRGSGSGARERGLGARDSENGSGWVRVVDVQGSLLALARPGSAPGSLHPSVVLI